MKSQDFFSIFFLSLFLMLVQCGSGGGGDSGETISSSGSPGSPTLTSVSNFEGLILNWDGTNPVPATIDSHFDFITVPSTLNTEVGQVKAINPNVKALFYRDALTYGSSYIATDVSSGKNCINKNWGWYLHDITNSNYRSALANYIASVLTNNTNFDGVYLDDVANAVVSSDYYQEGTSPQQDCTLPSALLDKATWQTNMISLLDAVSSAVKAVKNSNFVIANMPYFCATDLSGTPLWNLGPPPTCADYLSHVDGQSDEGTGHYNWQDKNTFSSSGSWLLHLQAMVNAVNKNKYWFGVSGVDDSDCPNGPLCPSESEKNQIQRYCYGTFLMGISGVNPYTKFYYNPSAIWGYYWYSDYGINLGSPTGNYSQISGKNSFWRTFQNCIVVVNPSDTQEMISLGETYLDTTAGQVITSLTLPGRDGRILLNTP